MFGNHESNAKPQQPGGKNHALELMNVFEAPVELQIVLFRRKNLE